MKEKVLENQNKLLQAVGTTKAKYIVGTITRNYPSTCSCTSCGKSD
ncbi:MAG: hypothetical protein HFJ26_00720 [Clostridia bacterium]|nr:hypothetical protein [Clostridia bacterium]